MKRILLAAIFFNISYSAYAQSACTNEQLFNLGDENKLSHTYYNAGTNSVFGIGYFTDTVTVGNTLYFAAEGTTGKYIVQLDTTGLLLNSFQVSPGTNFLEFTGGSGYFEPGIGVTDKQLFVPNVFIDDVGRYVFQVQALDMQGTVMWEKNMIGTTKVGANFGFDMIRIAPSGDIVLTGVYGDALTIEQQVITSGAPTSGFVLILDPTGVFKSITHITGSDQMEIFGLTTDDLNNIYVSGNAFNTEYIAVEGEKITYSGLSSAFMFKLDMKGIFQWAHIFESSGQPEPKAIQYDRVNDFIHYVNTDYESFEKGSKLGALHAKDGTIAWERNLVVPGSYYISYSSWIDYKDNSIYYSVWGKPANQTEASLVIDGKVFKDGINKNTYFHKFSLNGISQYISPSRFTTIGDIAMVNAGKIFLHANYQTSGELQGNTIGYFDPVNYPGPYLYVRKEGVYLQDGVTLYASSDVPDVTYQWMISGDPLANETKPAFTPSSPGQYAVEIYDGRNCPVRSSLYRVDDAPSLTLDSLALVDLYNDTNGAKWYNSTNWLQGPVSTWYGVTVIGGRITELFLANNNLSGTFPASMDRLTGLQQLYLDGNRLSGTIPETFWGLTKLIHINLHDNPNLKWSLHPDIQNMTALQGIRGFNTNLTGIIPSEIGNVQTLKELWVSNCNLTGGIPPTLGNLTALTTLDLADNPLGGIIPVELGSITALQYFRAGNCELTGIIPNEIWQLPNLLEIDVHDNSGLGANLPANLETLTQLQVISLANLKPMGTPFPEDLYSLINLISVDLGGHKLTGSLDSRVGNWKNLQYLWLWSNNLEGEIPAEMASLPLIGASFSDNTFTGIPDLDPAGTTLLQLEIERNFLGFDDIIRNLGLEVFKYSPQKKRPAVYLTVEKGGSVKLSNDYYTQGNQYDWVLNNTGAISSNADYTITGATFNDLGKYYCTITNQAVPDLTIETGDYNVAFSGSPESFTVDNSPRSLADFKSFYAAAYGTNDGDTLYVGGSSIPYEGYVTLERPRVIYGPGYFLTENSETQASPEAAKIGGIYFAMGSEGSEVYGLDLHQIMVNNQASYIDNTLRNITITGNKVKNLSLTDDCQNIHINKNYIQTFTFASTPLTGVSRSYQDILIENNIIDTVTTVFAKATAEKNAMVNVKFDRNTIKLFTDSIQNSTVSNSFIDDYQATANTVSNKFDFATAAFENNSGMLNIDNDFIATNTTLDAGAFSGTDPYILSGLTDIPHIFELTNIGRIRINTKAKSPAETTITSLEYRLGQNGVSIDEGTVNTEASNAITVLFRPRLGNVIPGGSYDLMLWATDNEGKKSIHHNLTFTAETTTATGHIYTSDNLPVTTGEVLLFEVNQEGTAFDTLSTTLNSEGGFTFSNIVVGDYLALGMADTSAFAEQLPTYYERIDLWEKADTLFIDNNNPVFDITLIPEPKHEEGNGSISGFLEEEVDEGSDAAGRMMKARKRVARAGVSVRRAVRTSRAAEVTYVLVAFVYTDEFGRFDFSNLPPDTYRLNIQYPGYPMDTDSNIDITIGGNGSDTYTVEALVAEGEIAVTVASITGLLDEIVRDIKIYPNPTSAEGINIKFMHDLNLKGNVELQLFDVQGNLAISKTLEAGDLKHTNEVYLSLNGIKKGAYVLKLYQINKELGTIRLMVY